jgi:hypothetical protein
MMVMWFGLTALASFVLGFAGGAAFIARYVPVIYDERPSE